MAKYNGNENELPVGAGEPIVTYGAQNRSHVSPEDTSVRERILTSTISVDEYFDELNLLVHKDYASL